MEKSIFSSGDIPDGFDERAKFSLWQEMHNEQIWSVEYRKANERPFEADIEALPVGDLVIGQMKGAIRQASRTSQHIGKDGRDCHLLLVNLGANALNGSQMGREYSLVQGEAALVSATEPFSMVGGDWNTWSNLLIPSQILRSAFGNIDDRLAITISADSEPLRLLHGYSRLIKDGGPLQSPDLIAHVTTTLVDLVGLIIGAKGEAVELAGQRGLRAARLREILSRIANNFTNPAISAQSVARDLDLSVGYVHELLQTTGSSFSETVLELRLQKAFQMLSEKQHDAMRISEIALLVGFGDVSYFNRCFRRRFGCSPGSLR